MNDAAPNGQAASQPEFAVQRLYIKDLSLEVPNSPQIFLKAWEPEINLDLATQSNVISEGDEPVHEVVLTVTVTVKLKEDVAFLVEVKQAGIFSLKGFPDEELKPMLGSYCPNLLYPYACRCGCGCAVDSSAVFNAGELCRKQHQTQEQGQVEKEKPVTGRSGIMTSDPIAVLGRALGAPPSLFI